MARTEFVMVTRMYLYVLNKYDVISSYYVFFRTILLARITPNVYPCIRFIIPYTWNRCYFGRWLRIDSTLIIYLTEIIFREPFLPSFMCVLNRFLCLIRNIGFLRHARCCKFYVLTYTHTTQKVCSHSLNLIQIKKKLFCYTEEFARA